SGVLAKIDAWARASDKDAVEPVYLVGDRQSGALRAGGALAPGLRNPTGYLRRALSYTRASGGALIVATEPATLAEAVEEVKKSGPLEVPAGSARPLGVGDPVDFGRGDFDASIH